MGAQPQVVLVAAVADNGVIGDRGTIPWRIPGEQRHFRELTTGHPVVMGRATFDSIGRPLPERRVVVVTRQPGWSRPGVLVAPSVPDAVALAADHARSMGVDAVMVAGGAQVYAAALPSASVQLITEVHQRPDGDTYYPAFDRASWRETAREEREGHAYVRWERR